MTYYTDELYHHGIKGQKWGQRRFQNEDGSLTAAGRDRYGVSIGGASRRAYAKLLRGTAKINRALGNKSMASSKEQIANRMMKNADKADKAAYEKREAKDRAFAKKHLGVSDDDYDTAMNAANERIARRKEAKQAIKDAKNSPEYKAARNANIKKAMIGAAVVGGVALAAYGGYKLSQSKKKFEMSVSSGKTFMEAANRQTALSNGYNKLFYDAAKRRESGLDFFTKGGKALDKRFEYEGKSDDAYKAAHNTAYYKLHTKKGKQKLDSKYGPHNAAQYTYSTKYNNANDWSIDVREKYSSEKSNPTYRADVQRFSTSKKKRRR